MMNEPIIYYSNNNLDDIVPLIKEVSNSKNIFIITDKNVYKFYHFKLLTVLKDYNVTFLIAKNKTYNSFNKISNELFKKGFVKTDLLISLGGGTIGDLTGFLASTIYRGVNYMQIPTTLLAMVDSSVGGKTALDTKYGKNLIGSFYNPLFTFIDTSFLESLSTKEYNNGYAESIKMALLFDVELYNEIKNIQYLTLDNIKKIVNHKKRIVLEDPYDKGIRRLLNFGHTFGHAIEKTNNYKMFKHGEAISHGMILAIEVGIRNGITNKKILHEVKGILTKKGLLDKRIKSYEYYLNDLKFDKKNDDNGLNFIILKEIGEPEIIVYKGN